MAGAPPPPSVDTFDPQVIVSANGLDFSKPYTLAPGFTATPVITRNQNPDGSVDLTVQAGKSAVTYFGPGLQQSFSADAAGVGFARANVGYVRLYAGAQADVLPLAYAPPTVGALGTNEYQSYTDIEMGGSFWDVVVPPATLGKAMGDQTSLTIEADLDCSVPIFDADNCASCASPRYSATAFFYQMDAKTEIGGVFVSQDQGFFAPCPIGAYKSIGGLTVGTPVLVNYGASASATAMAGNDLRGLSYVSTASASVAVDALSTGYMMIKDADGHPVTGQSGITYDGKPVLDPITTTTSTSTTTTFVPPTTLPGCDPGAYCGDGAYQPECGEVCDCPQPAPGEAATICAANVAVPNLGSPCALCVGCQVDLSACVTTSSTTSTSTTHPSITTTTHSGTTTTVVVTTLPGATSTTILRGASSTTTTVFTTTTTTVPPLPCTGLSGLARVQCQLTAALDQPLCGNEVVPPAVDRAVLAKLNAANAALGSATTAAGRKGKKLRKRAVGNLRAASARAARAVKAKNAGQHVSASCAGTIAGLTSQLVQEIAGP
jgi:hypothetical protein